MRKPLALAMLLTSFCLAACSQGKNDAELHDPYEGVNRKFHAFNAGLDRRVIKPATSGFGAKDDETAGEGSGVGAALMQGAGNFGANLSLPGKVVNHLLQAKPDPAIRNTFRFLVNSTLGFGGLLDPAGADFALPEIDTDFGETLAVWGVPEGAYLELPLLGPSTERDAVGKVVDVALDPLRQRLNRDEYLISLGARAASKVSQRARFQRYRRFRSPWKCG